MNRLTAIGLASLVAYGLLIASKYTGVVSAAREDRASPVASNVLPSGDSSGVHALKPEPRQSILASLPAPVPRMQPSRLSGIALEFRKARDLKSFADGLAARAPSLRGDERYYLAKALEECLFATTVNEDLAAYSAKQRKQFLANLTAGDPNNEKRIAAYEAADSTQRCLGFQNSKVSQKDIDALYSAAAQQGDPRAQARLITAELSKSIGKPSGDPASPSGPVRFPQDDFSTLVGLLQSGDPEAMMYVGQFLAQSAVSQNLRVGPNGEVPEPSAFLGAFTLVACDVGQDCTTAAANRELLQACAYGGYCNAQSFEEMYQDFLASPWVYTQAMRYRIMIHTAIDQQNWGLIGITPKLMQATAK
jgi:hypothetical protein